MKSQNMFECLLFMSLVLWTSGGHTQAITTKDKNAATVEELPPTTCGSTNARSEGRSVDAKMIVGFYKSPVSNALLDKDTPVVQRYNYLAISKTQDGFLRIRAATREKNGHNCGFDSKAVICGTTILLLPNSEEVELLKTNNRQPPELLISNKQIRFSPNRNDTFHFGAPYCGSMGGLDETFPRNSKRAKVNETVFGN